VAAKSGEVIFFHKEKSEKLQLSHFSQETLFLQPKTRRVRRGGFLGELLFIFLARINL